MDWYEPARDLQLVPLLGRSCILILVGFMAIGISGPITVAQQTYTVTATTDQGDANLGDGQCETSEGHCTVRAAIQEANESPSQDRIEFGEIASGEEAVVFPKSPLPTITETVVIDGSTEPSYTEGGGPVVVLAGDSLTEGTEDGLNFLGRTASGSRVRSLALVGFPEEGLQLHREVDGVTIEGCYFGVGTDGSTARGNGGSGMWVGSRNNQIGTPELGNVISGNGKIGIEITGDSNDVRGNLIGVTASGEGVLSNGSGDHQEAGILVVHSTDNNLVNNVVAGNDGQGIFVQGRSYRNHIRGNYIGTSQGLQDLGNLYNGVRIDASPETVEDRNIVYGQNIVAFNRRYGLNINGNKNLVANNFIGTNGSGDNLGNYKGGIRLAAQKVTVGRATVEGEQRPGNVIGYNGRYGVEILEGKDNRVRGNYIGTNRAGANLGNGSAGILILARGNGTSSGHQVGYGYGEDVPVSPSPSSNGFGNVIAYNAGMGIVLAGTGTTVRTTIRGNRLFNNRAEAGAGLGIDHLDDGPTENDSEDADDGPNRLQNTPEFDQGQTQYIPDSDEIEVRYKVDSDPSHSGYGQNGLKIDFYVADPETDRSGKTYLYTDEYPDSSAATYQEVSFSPPDGVDISESDHIIATATDANGNTSEFSSPSPLRFPVELAEFTVSQVGEDAVHLNWKTTEEVKNGRFRIEHRSPSAESFSELDFVEGKGTSDQPQDYSYRVEGIEYGAHTFQLVHVAPNGVTYRLPEKTVELSMGHRYVLTPPSPNPTRGAASFKFGVRESQPVRVVLYDALGREVRVLYDATPQAGQKETIQIDGTGLSSGRYFVRITGDEIREVVSFTLLR